METDGRRGTPLGQKMVVWRDAAQLKSTQIRMADMDCCRQGMPRPNKRQYRIDGLHLYNRY